MIFFTTYPFSKRLEVLLTFQKIYSAIQNTQKYLTLQVQMPKTKWIEMGAGVKITIMFP